MSYCIPACPGLSGWLGPTELIHEEPDNLDLCARTSHAEKQEELQWLALA